MLEEIEEFARAAGGKIESVAALPDGSGFAVMSLPLPENHWIYGDSTLEDEWGLESPPMPMRTGTDDPRREELRKMLIAAGKYAVRASTMKGKGMGFDPDALIQNLIVGMLGYHTPDGL